MPNPGFVTEKDLRLKEEQEQLFLNLKARACSFFFSLSFQANAVKKFCEFSKDVHRSIF